MYALVATANTRCAAVIFGAAQNTISHATYNGCRTTRYRAGVRNTSPVYGRPNNRSHTCRSPNRSKWLIRNVASSTVAQPTTYSAFSSTFPALLSTFQITPPIGCHFQNISSTAAQLNSKYVLRSIELGTMRVQIALNPGRAITVCCRPNTAINETLTASACKKDPCAPESMLFVSQIFPMKQNIY